MHTYKNRERTRLVATLSLIVLSMFALPAYSQYSGYYGEVFYGSGNTEFKFFTDLSDYDGDTDFYGLTIGKKFNDNVAAEVTYADLGNSESVISDPIIATLNAQFEAKALAISAIGTYPLGRRWDVFGKFGINQWDLEAKVTDNTSTPPVTLSGDDRGTGINYGIGVQYRITPRYSIKLEYLVYQLNSVLFEDDVVVGGGSVALRFNY